MLKKILTLVIAFNLLFVGHSIAQNYIISDPNPPEFYPELYKISNKPNKIGNYDLKVFGLKVYKIELYCENSVFSFKNKSAIVINYQRKFLKENLIERTIQEIARINEIKDQELLSSYKLKLQEIFFDVDKGDRKTAIFNPEDGVKLFLNGKLVGQIKDLIFAKRFMDIWLHEKSAYPKMTKAMLGKND